MTGVRIETERLVLRPMQPGDATAVFDIFSIPEVTRYYEIDALVEFSQAVHLTEHFIANGRFAILMSGRMIGSCGLFAVHQEYRSASLGYDLSSDFRGRGIMHEALVALLQYGFSSLGLNRINALVYPENRASIRVLEKLGFGMEGVMREFGFWKGQFHDMCLFALLARHWRASGLQDGSGKAIIA